MGSGQSGAEGKDASFTRKRVSEILYKLGDGKENVAFSTFLEKTNQNSKTGKNAILITDKAVYDFNSSSLTCKRRIDIREITLVSLSSSSDELVIHVPSSYDLHMRSGDNFKIVDMLAKVYKIRVGDAKKLTLIKINRASLKNIVNSERESEKNRSAGLANVIKLIRSTIKGISYDFLGLGQKRQILDMIDENSEDEVVKFSDYIVKVNRRGRMQKRILMITSSAVYNLTPSLRLRRRIPLVLVTCLTLQSSNSSRFILHVISEYDYTFAYERNRDMLVNCLRETRRNVHSIPLTVVSARDESFNKLCVTQEATQDYISRSVSLIRVSKKVNSQRRYESTMLSASEFTPISMVKESITKLDEFEGNTSSPGSSPLPLPKLRRKRISRREESKLSSKTSSSRSLSGTPKTFREDSKNSLFDSANAQDSPSPPPAVTIETIPEEKPRSFSNPDGKSTQILRARSENLRRNNPASLRVTWQRSKALSSPLLSQEMQQAQVRSDEKKQKLENDLSPLEYLTNGQ